MNLLGFMMCRSMNTIGCIIKIDVLPGGTKVPTVKELNTERTRLI